ncbi:MAG: hypothetical protein HC806_07965 [Anaerolineae bacterium]|nr:hypothetical protein [Anaerolineae bacterium]
MTEFFLYENLTWPEIADLPRDTPLIIPLGEGYPLDQLAEALSNPNRVGLLPPHPVWLARKRSCPPRTAPRSLSFQLAS